MKFPIMWLTVWSDIRNAAMDVYTTIVCMFLVLKSKGNDAFYPYIHAATVNYDFWVLDKLSIILLNISWGSQNMMIMGVTMTSLFIYKYYKTHSQKFTSYMLW